MAQKTEKEDVPETTLTPCISNMSLTATVSTNTNCFNNNDSTTSFISEPLRFVNEAMAKSREMKREFVVERMGMEKIAATNRCSGCRRKVGLTGFRCRCGDLFCSVHRYWDRHACSYDYKAAGKAAIARENPIVKSAKIVRI